MYFLLGKQIVCTIYSRSTPILPPYLNMRSLGQELVLNVIYLRSEVVFAYLVTHLVIRKTLDILSACNRCSSIYGYAGCKWLGLIYIEVYPLVIICLIVSGTHA
jgi:hypothetical protein